MKVKLVLDNSVYGIEVGPNTVVYVDRQAMLDIIDEVSCLEAGIILKQMNIAPTGVYHPGGCDCVECMYHD